MRHYSVESEMGENVKECSLFERGNSLEATRHRRKFPFVKGVPSIRSGHSPPLYKISIRGLRGKISAPASAQPSHCDLESKVAKHTRTTSAAAPASQIHITARLRSSNRQFHLKRLIYESRHGRREATKKNRRRLVGWVEMERKRQQGRSWHVAAWTHR